ncbi:UvrB/UvrC motif-containing protein [Mesobacillus subterraneus]|uniref:DNA helicase UvrC n=1 Tax=Mesobacillus subterraneus TaxID=285983 RepID=A0A427TQV6_9BACI|nr:UvrB/UvrC motif-containing protein [Mesobacillus subterraneus]RSD26814.1 DNA helicase UvrC [Mesobacillus subterraneus]
MNKKEKIKSLPLSAGVYLMKDQTGTIIYVGKAKSLKKRVQSYFYDSAAHPQKIRKLVANIDDFDYILTDTEFEAFMLECKLIKEKKPLFNKKMKSHLAYSYIAIKMDGLYRKIIMVPEKSDTDKTLYFGPYTSSIYVRKAIENLKEYLNINCLHPLKGTPCLNFTLGKCMGICLGGNAVDRYNEVVDQIASLLSGSDTKLLEELQQKMEQASADYQFEEAAKLRNYLRSFSVLLYKENMIQFTEGNQNIAVVERLTDDTLKLFLIKGHKVIHSEKLESSENLSETIPSRILATFREVSYGEPVRIGKEELDEVQIIYSYLNGSNGAHFMIIPDYWLETESSFDFEHQIRDLLIKV